MNYQSLDRRTTNNMTHQREAESADQKPRSEELDGLLDVQEIAREVHLVARIHLRGRYTILRQGPQALQSEQRVLRPAKVEQLWREQQNASRRG